MHFTFSSEGMYTIFMSYTLATLLFAKPSAISGAARMLDFWGYYDVYNNSRNGAEADAKAIYSDWRTVGEYLWEAYEQLTPEESIQREQRIERQTVI